LKPRTFRFLILLATLSLVGIVVIQIYWVNSAFRIQKQQHILQENEAKSQEKIFNDRVIIALTNVAETILKNQNDPSKLYNAVQMEQPNFFTVMMNDTLHPFYLESLINKEFERSNIKEDFEYAIYDCFSQELIYGDFVSRDENVENDISQRPQLKLAKDGHYFSVYFPNRKPLYIEPLADSRTPWVYSSGIILIVILFFGYSVWLILKQKRLSDIKNDFINNMTHELKTPISTISVSSEVLLREGICQDPERVNQYARIIFNENKRLESQVERVLQLATLDKEKIELRKTSIDVHGMILSCAANFRLAVEAEGGKLDLHLDAIQHVMEGDRVHLTNIIYNLIDNAKKYADKEPLIVVSTANERGGILISVKDNGIGIGSDALKHVFEKFYRVPTGNVHNVKGFGLGLYYVKMMTEQHQGTVSVKSEAGKGSEFILYFPIQNLKK
jgi:two-component system phosphate regulon sensor histidine kinase PhoR